MSEDLGEDSVGKRGLGFLCTLMALIGMDPYVLPSVWFATIPHSFP